MPITLLILIIGITSIISYMALKNTDLKYRYMFIPYKSKHERQSYRFFSHMFIHADLSHLMFNMFTLFFLGDFLEKNLIDNYGIAKGELHLFTLYFMGGIVATLIPYARNQENPNYMSLGASGAVSAVVFASILWAPTMKLGLLFIPIAIPAYIFGPLYLAYEFWADKKGGTGIAHDAHIGGAVFGIIYVLIINIDKGKDFIHLFF
jgi:membrane associated rhomboid family serine protease